MKTLALLAFWFVASAAGQKFDLVIRNGRVVDGAGAAAILADVAVKGDRIAIVGQVAGGAKRTIDANGLIVAPGFIDMHSHSDWTLLEDGAAQSKIRQGVTTEVIGESTSPGPFQGKLAARKVPIKGESFEIRRLADYFTALERNGSSVNVASYVGEGQVWECVMGNSFARPTKTEFEKMKALVAEAMEDGAFGLSTALMMPPSSLATTDDLVELCKVVHQYGGIYSTHMRDEGLGVFDSIKESISIAERAQVPLDIIHLKIADQKYWGRMKEAVALIEEARKRGVNVQANVYPYTRGNNDLSSIIPPWAHEGGKEKMLERLADPEQRTRLKKYIREGIAGWYNHYSAVGGDWSKMLISANNAYKGMTMDRVIASKREGKNNPPPDEFDVLFDVLIESNGSVSTVFAHHTEADMNLALRQPWCSIGSDGSALAIEGPLRRGNPHPRSFGTFPRVLGVYARDRGLLRMEDAVRKMTSLNAEKIGLRDRGVLRDGAFADITIFDAQKIIDRSTYEEPFQYAEGVRYVVVNGKVVLDDGNRTEARPGRALRHEVSKHTVFVGEAKEVNAKNAGEGPAWNAVEQCLYYTGNDRISRYYPRGSSDVFSQPSGGANGLLFNRDGALVVCEAALRRVTRRSTSGSILVLAALYEGKRFNSPNDLSIDSKGRIYFTDPRYGKRDTMEMTEEAVYRIDAPGKVARIITDLERPNGILVSPGDKYVYVADNNNNKFGGARKLWRYDLKADGSVDVNSKKLIFDWKTSRGPDGIKMDREGRLFVAAGLNEPNPPFETTDPYRAGVYVISPDGKLLDYIAIPKDECTNCAFGGPDLKTLYITAGGSLFSVGLNSVGVSAGQ